MLDRLDRKIYAEKIADEIKNHYEAQQRGDEEDGIVFAVSARWGEGKTFLLNSLEPMLRESGFTVVRFNPWQYSQEDISLKRAFLKILKDELRAEAIDLDDLYYDRSTTALDWRSFLPRVIRFLFWGFMATYIAPLIFGAEASSWWPTLNKALTSFWSSGVGGVLLAVFILPLLLKTITVSSRKAQVATAEEFDTKFKTLLSGHKKVVVFVDDLDRCTPSTVKTVLDSLKTFFNHPECSYVITGDHTVIERYAAEELNPSKKEIEPRDIEEGRRFLKKLFNVYWRLPLSTPKKFSGFVSDEINKVDLVLKETQKKRIEAFMLDDKFLERNPRHVKRFVLSLKFALQSVQLQAEAMNEISDDSQAELLADERESTQEILENPDLLAKVLLIQERFYPVYEKLVLHPAEIVRHEKLLRNKTGKVDDLAIGNKPLSNPDLLGHDGGELLEAYADLVRMRPQFTDDDGSVILDPTNFFSFSGATGLPSLKGPDDANFDAYLKSGQLDDRLRDRIESAPKDKKEKFATRAIRVFGQAVETERVHVVRESLKVATHIDEWAEQLGEWWNILSTLSEEEQVSLMPDWWQAVLAKNPQLIQRVKESSPDKLNTIWPILEELDISILHKDALPELERIAIDLIGLDVPPVGEINIFLDKFPKSEIHTVIREKLTNPDVCKRFMDGLIQLDLRDSKLWTVTNKKIKGFIGRMAHIDWLLANRDFIKSIKLLDYARTNLLKAVKNVEQLIKIAENWGALEAGEEEKASFMSHAISLVDASPQLEFLRNSNVINVLKQSSPLDELFYALVKVFIDSKEPLEKRKSSGELLSIDSDLWRETKEEDVHKHLKRVAGLKLPNDSELINLQKEILAFWEFGDIANDSSEEGS